MRKNSKDYKPWNEYVEDQNKKRAVAQSIAAQVHALTAQQHIDIGMLIGALQTGLWPTWRAAEELGISTRAFLRLRRKYGLEPIDRSPVLGEPQKVKYLYAPAQLTRIPASEIALSQRRSADALRRAAEGRRRMKARLKARFNPDIDLGQAHKLVA